LSSNYEAPHYANLSIFLGSAVSLT